MDIFKLIYEHDLRLDELHGRSTDRHSHSPETSIEEFMRPDPTYSRFYLTGSRLDKETFGLDILQHYKAVIDKLQQGLEGFRYFSEKGSFSGLHELLEQIDFWEAVLLTQDDAPKSDLAPLHIDSDSNVGHRKEPLRRALEAGEPVLYKERAYHGFDLHLFSENNIYRELFYPLKELVSPQFRFFSVNGKRIRTEHQFYFETWSLERPPHGAEEVFEETVL